MNRYSKGGLYQTEEEVGKALLDLSIFVCFAVATTIVCLSNPNTNIFFFNDCLDHTFFKYLSNHTDRSYNYLVSTDEWIDFVQNKFLRNLFYFSKEHKKSQFSFKIGENFVIGVPKLRQIRISAQPCDNSQKLETHFEECYPRYSYNLEDTSPYFQSVPFVSRKLYNALPFTGNAEKYNGPGYLMFLTLDPDENEQLFEKIKLNKWINNGTRLVLLELVVYNLETSLLGTVKLSAEILPTGSIIPDYNVFIVPLTTIWSPSRPITFCASVVFYLLLIFYIAINAQQFFNYGVRGYISQPRNIVDGVILMSAFVALSTCTQRPYRMHDFLQEIDDNPNALVSMDIIYYQHIIMIICLAICVFLVWAKVLRFIGFDQTTLQFHTTLTRCAKDILGFALMFFIVFMAFAICGLMIFGSTIQHFKNFQSALFSMVRMVLGDFQYRNVSYANRVLAAIFYLLYLIFINFILVNMFLAIINNTYQVVKDEITENNNVLRRFLLNLFRKLTSKLRSSKNISRERGPHRVIDDSASMFEFTDVQLTNVKTGKRPSRINSLRRIFDRPFIVPVSKLSEVDQINLTLLRLSERVDMLEDLLSYLKSNMRSVFKRRST